MANYHDLRKSLLSPERAYEEVSPEDRKNYVDMTSLGRHPFKLYGQSNVQFSENRCKLVSRMLVETKLDHTAIPMAEIVAETLLDLKEAAEERYSRVSGVTVVDPFAGAGNLLYHMTQMGKHLANMMKRKKQQSHAATTGKSSENDGEARDTKLLHNLSAVGFELDKKVFDYAHHNLKLALPDNGMENRCKILHEDSMKATFSPDDVPPENFVVVTVDPPWQGSEWDANTRFTLETSDPPVPDIIASFKERFKAHCEAMQLFFVIPCPKKTSVESIKSLFLSGHLMPLSPKESVRDEEHSPLVIIGLATPLSEMPASPTHEAA